MTSSKRYVGQAVSREDGVAKVTGQAHYAAEFSVPGVTYAALVQSTVPSGTITGFNSAAVERMPGVLLVMTYLNAPQLPEGGQHGARNPPAGRKLSLLQDNVVHYNGEPIAVVVAQTLEQARDAANCLQVSYNRSGATLDFARAKSDAYAPAKIMGGPVDSLRGDPGSAFAQAAVRFSGDYSTPMQHHNAMEPHATIAQWDGPHLTLYDSTQYVAGVGKAVATAMGLPPENVRTVCFYTGGGFGSKGSVWSHVVLTAMAARQLGRPVKLALERPQMFGPVGGRPHTEQRVQLASDAQGNLAGMRHDVTSHTSVMEDWVETSAIVTRMLYRCANQSTSHRLVKLNLGVPTFTRAPGEATGSFALEAALDELSYQLGVDPVELRLRNYAQTDPEDGKPFSSKSLRACYELGAARFGWERRNPQPRSMRDGATLIGWGMATATYPTRRSAASASARLMPDGSLLVRSASQDLGTGTYTIMTQIAADAMGFPIERVVFQLGDSDFPMAPVSGGSQSAASVGSAVNGTVLALRRKVLKAAVADRNSPFFQADADQLDIVDGWLQARGDTRRREAPTAVLARLGGQPLEVRSETKPGDEQKRLAMHSFGAVFAEVRVDPALGTVQVSRLGGTYGVGKLLNAKTGHSQLMGGMVWGLSMALLERSELDLSSGRYVNNNLGEYHVPVNADVHEIDIVVVDEQDREVNPIGAKGIGEIGITGVAAAIANAVYHATGTRVRDLPITVDKLIAV
jgi:xanthine dehydrogenase YagR molybdenum-binding subunit